MQNSVANISSNLMYGNCMIGGAIFFVSSVSVHTYLVKEGMIGVVRSPDGIEVVALHHQCVRHHGVKRHHFATLVGVLVSVRTGHCEASAVNPKLPLGYLHLNFHDTGCFEKMLKMKVKKEENAPTSSE